MGYEVRQPVASCFLLLFRVARITVAVAMTAAGLSACKTKEIQSMMCDVWCTASEIINPIQTMKLNRQAHYSMLISHLWWIMSILQGNKLSLLGVFSFYFLSRIIRLANHSNPFFHQNRLNQTSTSYHFFVESDRRHFLWLDGKLLWRFCTNAGYLELPSQ